MKSNERHSPQSNDGLPLPGEVRVERQNAFKLHISGCADCQKDETALCREGYRLLVAAIQ